MEESNVIDNVQPQDNAPAENQPPTNRTYDDLFPALPANQGLPSLGSAPPRNMRVGSSLVTQVFHVPYEERKSSDSEKFGEGESLRTCQQIMKETGANIEISSGKDNSLTFLIKGKMNEVLDARRKILIQFQTQASKQIAIPKEHRKVILGKRGERLRELEKNTSTKISVPSMNDDSDIITISGAKDGIEKAEHEIRTMVDEQSKKAFERLSVPKMYHPFVNGPYNETVNAIVEATGAKINVPFQSVMKDEITISGEKDAVYAAKEKIEEICRDMEKRCSTVSVEVSKSQHRHIFGQRGQTLQEILKETGVWVEMPPSDSNTDTITLRGPQNSLGNALTTVYQKANSVKTVTIDAPSWIHKYIIGRKGANIEKFEQEFPNINVFCLDNYVKLEGPPETVDQAQAHLANFVQEFLEVNTFAVMKMTQNCVKHIIGKGGVNIKRLKEELQLYVNIDEFEIRIEGKKDVVAKVQLELEEKINKLENEKVKDVIIEQRLHRSVIGAKGEKIREIKDRYKNVQITFPSTTENSDIVKLRGPKEDVDKFHKDLMKLVKEIKESSYDIEVPIFKQFHKFIIGKGGANIKKIRDETQTKIDLPSEGDTNEVIRITGKKENVLEAQQRIQKIQNELSELVTEEVQIPPKYYNFLIGTGGKLISSIMEEFGGVSIKFPPTETKSDKVTIRGPKDDVEKAKCELLKMANERQLTSFTAEVRSKQQHHRFIIGKNGASIRKIREATGARIIFPSNDCEDKELITIMGKEENVLAAKQQLETIISDIEKETEDEINVPQKYHKHFVAKRCEVLQKITYECGNVQISFPRQGEENERVKLKGAKDCIEAAKARINEIVDDLEAQVTIEVVISQKHHRNIMGSRGAKVQAITREYDVQIKFPDREATEVVEGMINGDEEGSNNNEAIRHCDIIRITGRKEKCEAAKKALIDSVPITEEVDVPFDLHRSIIGQKGRDVREFMSTYDVYIELSPQELKQDTIKITGTPANVEIAKEALAKRVEELEADRKDRDLRSFELKMQVDLEYYPKIIGRKGTVVQKLKQDHNVQISFPKKEDENDNVITIIGYEADAIACRDEILKMVGALEELCKEVVEINAEVHNRLIGKRGRTIRRIMDDYKVDIKFPKEGDANPNAVTITGQEEDVENAREHILQLEEEYLQDMEHTVRTPRNEPSHPGGNPNGFVIQGAPWEQGKSDRGQNGVAAPNTQSQLDFPDFGGPGHKQVNDSTPMSSAWGPKR